MGLVTSTMAMAAPSTVATCLLAALLPLLLPVLQFGLVYRLWEEHAVVVRREACQNSCWDTVFKAGYETGAGSYKHVYFNATWQAGLMWALTLASSLLLYEAVRYLAALYMAGRLRPRLALLFLSSVYPHYYAFWTTWGYLNDDFYEQLPHQLLFTLTEAASSLLVLRLADLDQQASPRRLLAVAGVAGGHVLAAMWDQFLGNVMRGEGGLHQVLRDLGFMLPDILHIVIPLQELASVAAARHTRAAYLVPNSLAATTAATALAIWLLSLAL